MSGLKPCPFCGGAASVEPQIHNSVRPDDFVASCTNELCHVVAFVEGMSEGLAIEAWNTRHLSLDEVIKCVRETLKKYGTNVAYIHGGDTDSPIIRNLKQKFGD